MHMPQIILDNCSKLSPLGHFIVLKNADFSHFFCCWGLCQTAKPCSVSVLLAKMPEEPVKIDLVQHLVHH